MSMIGRRNLPRIPPVRRRGRRRDAAERQGELRVGDMQDRLAAGGATVGPARVKDRENEVA